MVLQNFLKRLYFLVFGYLAVLAYFFNRYNSKPGLGNLVFDRDIRITDIFPFMVKNSSIQILNPGKVVERLLKPSVNFSEKNNKQTQASASYKSGCVGL